MSVRNFHQEGERARILYAGDDDVDRAAQYLATILASGGYSFDYIPSNEPPPATLDFNAYDLVILSDYPRKNFSDSRLQSLTQSVSRRTSLLMIGGWESFRGYAGEYSGTALADVLPVAMKDSDDRRNLAQGCLVLPTERSAALAWNPWTSPPLVAGLNEVQPLKDAEVLLVGRPLVVAGPTPPKLSLSSEEFPLLITRRSGQSRQTALAFDLAPHWVGGFVDWGDQRVRLDWNRSFIEVGNWYRTFVIHLIALCLDKGR